MADITRDDIFDKDLAQPLRELNEEFAKTLEMLKKTTLEADKTNASLKSGGSDEAAASTRKLAEEQKKLIAAQKEQQKAADALQKQRQKALEQIAKLEQQQRELVEAANMEAKTYEQLSQKMSALNKLRKQQDLSTQEGRAAYQSMTKQVMDLNKQLMAMDAEVGTHSRNVGNYKSALDTANMSLGEMKRELRELRNMSFAGMDPEQIAKVRARMAELTDEIGDFQAQIRTASADAIPSIINGLQGIVAGVELVTGTMSLFGVENENLEKNMIALIGVSQALGEVYELYEKKTLAVAWATLKKTAATVKDTIATAANAAATGAAAAKTAALAKGAGSLSVVMAGMGGSLKSLVGWLGKLAGGFAATAAAALAVAAAIVGGILLLEKYKNKVDGTTARIEAYNKAVKRSSEVQKEAAEKSASTIVKLQALQRIVNDSTNSEYSRKKALEEVKNETNGVINVTDLSSSSLRKLNAEIKTYISMIQLQAQAEAAYNLAVTAYQDAMKLKASGLDKGIFSTPSSALRKQGQEVKALTDDAEEYMNMFNEYTNMANDLLNGFGENVNRTVEEINADIKSLNERYAERGMIGGEEEYKRRLKNLQDELATVQKINEEKNAGSSSKNNLDKLTKDVQETQKEIVDVWSEIDETFDKEDNITETTRAIENMGFTLKSFEREKTVLDTMFDGMIEGLENADVTMQTTKTKFQVAVGAMNNAIDAIDDYRSTAQTVYSSIDTIIQNSFDKQSQLLNEQQKQSDEYYANKMKAYKEKEGSEAAQEELAAKQLQDNKRIEREKIRLARKEAIYERSKALFEIGIATATAIIKQLAATPLPYGAPFLAAVTAAGVAQTAAVLSKPIPQYYTGLDDAKTDHLATIAERGRELMQLPDGSLKLFDEKQPVFVPKHSKIYDNAETEALLNGLIISSMNGIKSGSKNDYDFDKLDKRLAAIDITIKRKPVPMLKSGYSLRDIDYIKRYDV